MFVSDMPDVRCNLLLSAHASLLYPESPSSVAPSLSGEASGGASRAPIERNAYDGKEEVRGQRGLRSLAIRVGYSALSLERFPE